MDDFPVRLAGFLELIATKARSLTVDRASNAIRLTTLGIIAGAFAFMAIIYLMLTIFGALEIPLGTWGAFAVLAGLFTVAGAFIWSKRTKV